MLGTKKKMMTAVFMLVISVLMLTTASFAWFTISTNPEITKLTTQVVVNENLEIALAKTTGAVDASAVADTGNQYTWGNIINLDVADLNGAATGTGNYYKDTLVKTLRPVKFDSTFQYPTYGTDGRINELLALKASDRDSGFGYLTDAVDEHGVKTGKVYGYYVDFWLRTNLAAEGGTAVTLSAAAKPNTTAAMGGGTVFTSTNDVLSDNVGIAFQTITTNTTGTITAATPTAGTGSTSYAGNVVTLKPNEAQLVRMFVYLNGANVTNASAALEGTPITGSLNIQFAIAGVDQSMDGQA